MKWLTVLVDKKIPADATNILYFLKPESDLLTNDTNLAYAAPQRKVCSVCVAPLPTQDMANQNSVTFLLKSYRGF